MSSKSFSGRVAGIFEGLGSMLAVASATRQGRPARDADLRRLGIDPQQFRSIGR